MVKTLFIKTGNETIIRKGKPKHRIGNKNFEMGNSVLQTIV